MSPLWSRRILWVTLLLTLPVPMWFIGMGRAPTLALFQVSAYMFPMWLTEGGPGAALALQALGAQAVFWAVVLYFVARVGVGLLARLGGGQPPTAAVAAVVACLFVVSLFQVYVTPIIARGAPVNLLGVY